MDEVKETYVVEDEPNGQRRTRLWSLKLWRWHGAVATKTVKHDCLAACGGVGVGGGGEGEADHDGRGAEHRKMVLQV